LKSAVYVAMEMNEAGNRLLFYLSLLELESRCLKVTSVSRVCVLVT
jgi:hypothetical protein